MSKLSAKGLVKTYRSRQIVANVDLSVSSGEIIGLLGANGAGKTTSFYIVAGLITADQGSIYLNDHNISHLSIAKRAQLGLGYLPQESSIFRKLTVAENIMAVLELHPKLNKKEELENLLQEFQITHLRDNLGLTLSGGERRRVEIARSLASKPFFLLLDEPFAGIDPISIEEIKRIIKYLQQKGLGILITDHNVRETLDICDRGYIMYNGEIIKDGLPTEILTDEQVRKTYLGKQFKL